MVFDDTFSPEWIPILNCRVLPGRWLILNSLRYVTKRKDILAMCPACLFPFLSGRPDTTKHESLLVSTLKIHKKKIRLRTLSDSLELGRKLEIMIGKDNQQETAWKLGQN